MAFVAPVVEHWREREIVILDFWVKIMSELESSWSIYPEKFVSYMNLGAPVQRLFLHDGGGGHLGFGPLGKNAGIFGKD